MSDGVVTEPAAGGGGDLPASGAIDFPGLADECLQETDRLIQAHGPRLPGSQPSRDAACELADELRGFCDHVRVEEFTAHPASFYAYTKLLPVVYCLGMVALLAVHGLYWLPAIGIVAGVGLMWAQFGVYTHLGDRLFPVRSCLNVEGTIEPAEEAEIELIISGHHDSAPVARIYDGPFQRLYAVAIFAPYLFYVLELGLLVAMLVSPAGVLPAWAPWSLVAGLPFVIGYFFLVDTGRGSPGAGDNLIASVLVTRIARELAARRGELLRRTRLRVVSFDAEEAGLRGSAAYFRAHRAGLSELPVLMLNFDSLYSAGDLHVLLSDVNGTVPLSRGMAGDAVECLRADGYQARPFALVFGAGATDAAEAARAGITATTVIAMSTAVVRSGVVYHTRRDTVDAIEPAAIEACLRLVVRYVGLLEASQARGLPQRT